MFVYNYHPETKEFLGTTKASIDPMATKRIGVDIFLLPANATFIPCPPLSSGEIALYKNNEWVKIVDKRGIYYSKIDGSKVIIDKIGIEPDELLTKIEKPSEEYEWNNENWEITLKTKKDKKIQELSELTSKKLYFTLSYNFSDKITGTIQVRNEYDKQNIRDLFLLAIASKIKNENTTYKFKDEENIIHDVNIDEIIDIYKIIENKIQNLLYISWELKKNIDNLKTIDDVEKYELNFHEKI